jgi:hypothetical protein
LWRGRQERLPGDDDLRVALNFRPITRRIAVVGVSLLTINLVALCADSMPARSLGSRNFRVQIAERRGAFGDTFKFIAVAMDAEGIAKRYRLLGDLGRKVSAAQTPSGLNHHKNMSLANKATISLKPRQPKHPAGWPFHTQPLSAHAYKSSWSTHPNAQAIPAPSGYPCLLAVNAWQNCGAGYARKLA